MLKIIHRVNTIEKLKKVPNYFGVEIDIHGWNKQLTIHHDALQKGEDMDKWLNEYKHKFVIFNIKEEGIEEEVLKKIKLYKLKNYFFLDLSFPSLVKLAKIGEKNCAFRVSKFESIEGALSFKNKVDWIWLDVFEGIPLKKNQFNALKELNYKICLVSPELHGRHKEEIENFKSYLIKHEILVDAVCTKYPDLWG